MTQLKNEIIELKKKQNAIILSHFYEDSDIQDVADFVGDSLFLAQQGQSSNVPVILLAGVVFMGESVKILSPEKTVLVPDLNAGCSLVEHSPFAKYKTWKEEHANSILMTYINSSAEVKSISDVICTSSNAEKIVQAIPADKEILFGPDHNLGRYLAKKLNRKMKLWPGACEVHVLFSDRKLFELKHNNPEALVLAHPECMEPILKHADVIGSTSLLLETVKTHAAKQFIVATEAGILHNMQLARPDAKIVQAPAEGSCACNNCPYMKLNSLQKIKNALVNLDPRISLSQDLLDKAQLPLIRMMDISKGKPVQWNT